MCGRVKLVLIDVIIKHLKENLENGPEVIEDVEPEEVDLKEDVEPEEVDLKEDVEPEKDGILEKRVHSREDECN